jgi:hypothetical protein
VGGIGSFAFSKFKVVSLAIKPIDSIDNVMMASPVFLQFHFQKPKSTLKQTPNEAFSAHNSENMSGEKPLIVADASKGIKVNSGVIAKKFRDEIKAKVASMTAQGLGK